MKRVLVYSHDTFGLGNIRRMLDISRHLVATHSDVSVLTVSGSPMLQAFRIPPRVDYIKLPCLARSVDGTYDSKFLKLRYPEIIRLRANLLVSAILDFAPDLILVDKKPFGVSNELRPALELLQRRGARPKLVLLLRDILDSADVTAEVWRRNRYHEALAHFYDRVLVVGSREIFDLGSEYGFPAASAAKLEFCGYLRREPGVRSREEVRDALRVGDDPMVLVTAGGGEDGYRLLSTSLRALAHASACAPVRALLVCGPEMSEQRRRRIHAAAAGRAHLVVQDFNDDMMGCMDAADLIVCMGGYNTLCEVLTLHKRAIVVPRVVPVQEQWMRAERMDRLGLLRAIHPDRLTPAELGRAIREELSLSNVRPSRLYEVDLGGMGRVAQGIHELLAQAAEANGELELAQQAGGQ